MKSRADAGPVDIDELRSQPAWISRERLKLDTTVAPVVVTILAVVLIVLVHVVMVILVPRTFPTMLTGRVRRAG